MTNSIASAKCPVFSSGHYGMSQNRFTDESKEYIFVKLTDSAFRAVEEYQRNKNATRFGNGQCAKIQFIGNSGVIHIPTPDNGEGRKFGFAIDDVEGSLECIQQQQNELDVLGSLSYRMRIQANDDIYDTTRTKMAIAEETEKSKCIREIKPNQTDIGRKVKKPASSFNHNLVHNNGNSNNSNSSNSYLSNSINRNKLGSLNNSSPLHGTNINAGGGGSKLNSISSTRSSPNPLAGGANTINSGNSNSRYGSNHSSSTNLYSQNNASSLPSLTTASSLSSALAGGISSGYAFTGSPNESSTSGKSKLGSNNNYSTSVGTNAKGGNSLLSGSSSNGGKSTGNSMNGNNKLPDISRRKIRERLVHLLALRPFKKPELYDRLRNEGIRDRERAIVSTILKDISTMSRDNTYNLRRQIWNDVNENWPYYTEQELQQLKRRKPQNLTPPLSSDAGSSTSGQSPTSTHTGSPPPLVGNGVGSSLKRTSLENYDDNYVSGVQPKKQRISHFKKDTTVSSNLNTAARLNYGNASNGAQQSKTMSYSPLGGSNTQATDENSGNSDLSYSVLDNVDDFMPHIDQGNNCYGGNGNGNTIVNSRKSNVNAVNNTQKNKSSENGKDKRNSGSNNSSNASSSGYSPQERSNNNSNESKKKVSTSSPLPYGNNFVPESKSSNSRNANNSTNGYQRQSPNYTQPQQQQQHQQHQQQTQAQVQHHKSSNIFSPQSHTQSSPLEESSATTNRGNIIRHQQTMRSSNKSKRTPTPPMPQQYSYQQSETISTTSNMPQQISQEPAFRPRQIQQHSSPTQEIADAVSTYTSMSTNLSDSPDYDFSNYQPITSIEQRRRYKTEFETDYKEYISLLERITAVGLRFRKLAEQLENTAHDCTDYYRIKQQIVTEYARIRNEETLQTEKTRFNYLHAKLAYIKQLVSDYDKTLTNGNVKANAAVSIDTASTVTDHQTPFSQQQNAYGDIVAADTNAIFSSQNTRLSPMVGSGESNSPPISNHYHLQQHHPQNMRYEHHDVETIQHDQFTNTHLTPTQSSPSHTNTQIYNGHNAPAHNDNIDDSDSDDSSSDSDNGDDDDDDDDDDDEDSNSNYDEDDNDHY